MLNSLVQVNTFVKLHLLRETLHHPVAVQEWSWSLRTIATDRAGEQIFVIIFQSPSRLSNGLVRSTKVI